MIPTNKGKQLVTNYHTTFQANHQSSNPSKLAPSQQKRDPTGRKHRSTPSQHGGSNVHHWNHAKQGWYNQLCYNEAWWQNQQKGRQNQISNSFSPPKGKQQRSSYVTTQHDGKTDKKEGNHQKRNSSQHQKEHPKFKWKRRNRGTTRAKRSGIVKKQVKPAITTLHFERLHPTALVNRAVWHQRCDSSLVFAFFCWFRRPASLEQTRQCDTSGYTRQPLTWRTQPHHSAWWLALVVSNIAF